MAKTAVKTKSFLPAVILLAGLTGCQAVILTETPPVYFIPPTAAVTPTAEPSATPAVVSTSIPRPTENAGCSNLLAYIKDLTIPDGSMFSPGESIDKRWQVENQGTCNWNSRYSLRLTGGDPMGAASEQSLFPALAGNQAVIRINFKAPAEGGKYRSSWQAYSPDSKAFGDPIFIEIDVIPRVAPSPLP
jgi:hypothetical protein